MDKEELQYGADASVDASSVIIEDYAGDQMVKVYPYFLPNTNRGVEFLQSNATTLVYYTQDFTGKEELEEDEDGNAYFKVLPSMTTATQEIANAGITKFSQELSEVKGFSLISNYWPKAMKKNLTLGQFNLTPMVFTIGAPLNTDAWAANVQPVFMAANVTAAKDSESDLAYEIVEEGLFEASLVNVYNLTTQYSKAAIQFVNQDLTKINNIGLVVPTNSLFGGAYGRSIINGNIEDISLGDPKKYPIWNASPIAVDNRLEMFMKWADTKMVLPIKIISKFKSEQPLSKLFKDDADAWLSDGEALYTLLKDMILYTQMYVNGWNDIQATDKLSDPTNSNYGTIKVNVTLGSDSAPATYTAGKKVVNLVVGKNPAEVVETLYESYLRENPNVDKNTLAIFKAAVVALSRYVRAGNLAMGGGLNDFNSIYLPWRLKMANKINITRTAAGADANYALKEDPQVVFDSHWYEFDGTDLKGKLIDNLYETQLVQAERNITQPLIPMELSETSMSSNPGGVNINSDSELRYNWIIPTTDQNVLDKLLLKDLNVTVTDPVDQTLNDKTAKITDPAALKAYAELKAALGTNTLAADWASETKAVKDALAKWYQDHLVKIEGSGFVNAVANFFQIFGPAQALLDAEEAIIKASGYEKAELESFGAGGIDWLVLPSGDEKLQHVIWNFMKVIELGFDTTGFETIPHKDQWNGAQFTAVGGGITDTPTQNWLREIKGSWLGKYLTDEAGLTEYLKYAAADIQSRMGRGKWATASLEMPEAKFKEFFGLLKDSMTFASFKLTINGTLASLVTKQDTPPSEHVSYPTDQIYYNGKYYWWYDNNVLKNAAAIINTDIIEQVPTIYPNAITYKLKAGTVQSFNLGTNRKLIFTKDEWQNLIRAIRPTNYYETIPMSPIKGEYLGQIRELDIFLLWSSAIILDVDGNQIVIDSINDYDEKIVKQKIIFS